jgi:hypothetical protein
MLRSSIALGCLPDTTGVISWIPPEAVSGAILDVALGDGRPERALNVAHPRPIAWTTMVQAAADELFRLEITRDRLRVVPMSEWSAKLADAAVGADEERLKRIVRLPLFLSKICLTGLSQPAIKLVDFFALQGRSDAAARASDASAAHGEAGGLVALSLEKVQHASKTMRELQPLEETDVARWIGYWKAKGLFDGMDQ